MANLEDEIRDLREKNSELAKEVQSLKILAAQKDKEKLELTKEVNELRLKISRLRSGGAAQMRKLDAGLQSASEEALSHLVQASGAVARSIEIVKQYIQEKQELDCLSPKWSNISSSSADKINKVPPMMLGGQSIQPVVSLSRTMLSNRSINRSPNHNGGVTQRAVPIHMLQDVYIPLTRIDASDLTPNNNDSEDMHRENSVEDLGLEDSGEPIDQDNEDSHNLTSVEEMDETHGLDAVLEESMEHEESRATIERRSSENPLEGPSWLLDVQASSDRETEVSHNRASLEPDSTTPTVAPRDALATRPSSDDGEREPAGVSVSLAFTPTVRRRKRTSSPPAHRKHSGRVLKVVVAKMRLSDESPGPSGASSPPKRPLIRSPRATEEGPVQRPPRFDAPSPNGATDAGVIVCETTTPTNTNASARLSRRDSHLSSRGGRGDSRDASRDDSRGDSRSESRGDSRSGSRFDCSDGEGAADGDARSRRSRKQVSYKEKPLNRKLRR